MTHQNTATVGNDRVPAQSVSGVNRRSAIVNTIVSAAAIATAAALPASAANAISASACTLPPELIERFVRMRAWYLEDHKQWRLRREEIDKRFYATTGITFDEYRDLEYEDPRRKELSAVHHKLCDDISSSVSDEETERLGDERWSVVEAIMEYEPKTIVDLAWQAEAFLIADLEIVASPPTCSHERLIRLLFHHIRTLGALPQPEDPRGALSIDISEYESDDGEEA